MESPGVEPDLTSELLTDAEVEELRSFFDQYDVEFEDQVHLLAKLDAGDRWLSFDPEAVPVAEETYVDDGVQVSVSTYDDGSVAVGSVSVPEDPAGAEENNTVTPQRVRGCSVTSSAYASYWRGCVADVNLGVVRMYFDFNYEFVRGQASKITYRGNYNHHIVGGALTNHRFVDISNSDKRYAADFSLAFQGFPVGWTAYMGVRVNGATATTYNN